jgi:hypothetical protein
LAKSKIRSANSVARKKIAAAALREAHRLNDGYAQQNSTNKKLAIAGLTVLVLSLIIPALYDTFSDDPTRPGYEFNATVSKLYKAQNGEHSTWFATIIRLESKKHGEVFVEVDKELYPVLVLQDEVQVGFFAGPSTIKFRVMAIVDK